MCGWSGGEEDRMISMVCGGVLGVRVMDAWVNVWEVGRENVRVVEWRMEDGDSDGG